MSVSVLTTEVLLMSSCHLRLENVASSSIISTYPSVDNVGVAVAETTPEAVETKPGEVCGVMLLDKPPKDTETDYGVRISSSYLSQDHQNLLTAEESASELVDVSTKVAMRRWPT